MGLYQRGKVWWIDYYTHGGKRIREPVGPKGKVYGGGLHKLEPRELANVPVRRLMDLLPKDARPPKSLPSVW